jgi:hypothetical protein
MQEAHADVGGQDDHGVVDEIQARLQRNHAGPRGAVVCIRAVQLSGDGRHSDADVGGCGGQPVQARTCIAEASIALTPQPIYVTQTPMTP